MQNEKRSAKKSSCAPVSYEEFIKVRNYIEAASAVTCEVLGRKIKHDEDISYIEKKYEEYPNKPKLLTLYNSIINRNR